MKRKITKFLLPLALFLSFSSLVSCGAKPFTGRVHLDYGEIRDSSLDVLDSIPMSTYNNLKSKIINKESFYIFIKGKEGCGCWTDLNYNGARYINETHTRAMLISYVEFINQSDCFGLYTEQLDMPSVAIFNRGKLVYQIHHTNNGKIMDKYDNFKQFMDEHVYVPKMYYISKTTLDSYLASTKEFNLYIARSDCGDCQQVNKDVLYSWQEKTSENVEKPLYIFDVQDYYADKTNYQLLKNSLGLSEEGNQTYGWSTGFVPTFQNRTGSTINDMITVYNDSCKDTIVSSYFSQARLTNLKFLTNDTTIKDKVLDGMRIENFDRNQFYNNYHKPLTNLFLNTYVK